MHGRDGRRRNESERVPLCNSAWRLKRRWEKQSGELSNPLCAEKSPPKMPLNSQNRNGKHRVSRWSEFTAANILPNSSTATTSTKVIRAAGWITPTWRCQFPNPNPTLHIGYHLLHLPAPGIPQYPYHLRYAPRRDNKTAVLNDLSEFMDMSIILKEGGWPIENLPDALEWGDEGLVCVRKPGFNARMQF